VDENDRADRFRWNIPISLEHPKVSQKPPQNQKNKYGRQATAAKFPGTDACHSTSQ
jgi:hypothetical protein